MSKPDYKILDDEKVSPNDFVEDAERTVNWTVEKVGDRYIIVDSQWDDPTDKSSK